MLLYNMYLLNLIYLEHCFYKVLIIIYIQYIYIFLIVNTLLYICLFTCLEY